MKLFRYVILTLLGALGLLCFSCIDDDITTSPSAVLTFSRDTVSFDTVFTEIGTPTARLIVRNPNKKGVSISYIGFKDPETRYRLNVDGQSGQTFHDVEIRGRDSIYVFIECRPEASPTSEPTLIEDQLQFVTNGNTQEVTVEAWGQNVTRLHGVVTEGDMTLDATQPYVVFDSLVVSEGTTLHVTPGTRLLFHDDAKLRVEGTLDARGEAGRLIDMRGDRLDNVLPDISYDIMAGQWGGVSFAPGSFGNRMEYVNLRSSKTGVTVDSCADLSRQKLLLVNSWLHNSQGNVLTSRYANVDAYGCVFSEAANDVVALYGGRHKFVQCTFANYYLFSAITGSMIALYHALPEDVAANSQPLMEAEFENGIIYGLGSELNEGDLTGSSVYLRRMLLGSKGEDDANFLECIWDSDPLFYTVREDYIFDYRLRPESPAIAAGYSTYVTDLCRFDMYGLNRLAAGAPDLGAFVYVAPPPEEK